MVLRMELNLGRDKTGDVGKFHTRDHMLLISNPFSLKRPFGHFILLFDISFSLVFYGKQGLF